MPATFVIAAGGTAGHVVPALAVAAELRDSGDRVVFVGGERAELELVPAAGFELHRIPVEGLSRTNPLLAARAAVRAARATRRAGRILRRERPAAVLGAGGYVAGPVGLAATAQRLPLVLSEADSHLGLANRLLAPRARRVCLAFPIAGREGAKYLVTGRPVFPPATDRRAARAAWGLGEDEDCVVVFGGSLGARSINQAAVEGLAEAPFRVLHVAGRRDYQDLGARVRGERYELIEYLELPRFSELLLAGDLAIARAGGSVFEIAAAGRPAVLVPYPHAAADHQEANARWMEQAGAAVVVPDRELTPPRLARTVGELLGDRRRLAAMARASAGLARPDAARRIADELRAAARANP
jgi:UDP-N-acetylglucosamine--N-acetylmuramyl-(pentapeptide) pyrophosphoryl-undecaprenol N-acetylglucosamine transferase